MPLLNSTWILELPFLEKADWVTRHEHVSRLRRRTRQSIALRMSPDMLLEGEATGRKVNTSIIMLRDIPDRKPKVPDVSIFYKLDWCTRHEFLSLYMRHTQGQIIRRMSPDMLLQGLHTSKKPQPVIVLKDKPKRARKAKKTPTVETDHAEKAPDAKRSRMAGERKRHG